MEDILAIVLIFGGGLLCALSFSPIGRAVAERIRGKGTAPDTAALRNELAEHREALDQELESVRREVAELAERVDFAERLLAKQREPDRLVPPKAGGQR
jgi:hypothetical protein